MWCLVHVSTYYQCSWIVEHVQKRLQDVNPLLAEEDSCCVHHNTP